MVKAIQERSQIKQIVPYKPGKPIEELQREMGISDVCKLASNENPLGPSPKAIEAIREAAASVNLYPDGSCFSLSRALAQKLSVNTDQLIFGTGSEQLIFYLCAAYVNEGDEVIIADPSFSMYINGTQIVGGKIIPIPVDAQLRSDLPSILNAINERTRMIFICNPNNPTGTIVTKSELDAFMAEVPEDVLVILDEAYCEYVENEYRVDGLDYLRAGRNVVVLRTFSKAYGLAGLRIGYGITTPAVVDSVSKVRGAFNINALAQKAALAALEDTEHLSKVIKANNEARKYFYKELKRLGISYTPTQANFILMDIGRNDQEAFRFFLSKGIIIRTADIYGFVNHIRVSTGSGEENQRFIKALEEFLNT